MNFQYLSKFVLLFYKEFDKNQCLQRASALAYATLLAMVPILVLSLTMFTHFVELGDIKQTIQAKLLDNFLPRTGNAIFGIVSVKLDEFVANAKTINMFGVIGLALTAVSLFTTIESSFNTIWNVGNRRSFFSRYNAFCGMLIGMPLLIGGSIYLSYSFNIKAIWLPFPFLEKVVFTALPLVLTWGAFVLLYHQVPFTKVQWAPCVLAGIVAGTLWEAAKFGFGVYVAKAVNISLIYGPVGSILFFLLWLYFTWVIVLSGVVLSYVAQNFKTLAAPEAA